MKFTNFHQGCGFYCTTKAKTIDFLSLFQVFLFWNTDHQNNVPLETRWDWFSTYDLLNHRDHRICSLWQAKQKFYSRSHKLHLFTVELTMNLTYQTVMRSSYKPGEILSNAQ